MAAHTVVVLDSSSPPPAFRHPSVTPRKSAGDASSSPGLPEVSTFFQEVGNTFASYPVPVLSGFASAGTLWKAAALEEAERNEKDGTSNIGKKGVEKLSRPEKKVHMKDIAEIGNQARPRTASVSLSEFDFRPDDDAGEMQPPKGAKKVAKKAEKSNGEPRKIAKKPKDASDTVPNLSKRPSNPTSTPTSAMSNALVGVSKRLESMHDIETSLIQSGHPWRTRQPSISISDFSCGSRGATPANETHGSVYFPPPASHTSQSPSISPKRAPKVAAMTTMGSNAALAEVRLAVVGIETEAASNPPKIVRKGSIALSGSGYKPCKDTSAARPARPKPASVKKSQKQTAASKDAPRDGPAKKPKKRFAKSESIILNSDEPDSVAGEDPESIDTGQPSVKTTKTVISAPKLRKQSKNATGAVSSAHSAAPPEPGFGIWSQSVYFNPDLIARTVEVDTTAESLRTVFAANCDIEATSLHPPDQSDHSQSPRMQTSFARRRSWTPAKNTYDILDPEVDSAGEIPAPRKSLADLVGNFGYSEEVGLGTRTPAGEPATKKRRIEVGGDSAVIPPQRKAAAVKDKVKKVKAPKRKPQTITDLATKAYRPEEADALNGQSTVSEFFAAANEDHTAAAAALSQEASEVIPTVKKPRKSRAKKADGKPSAPKKISQPKKVKVKFNEPAVLLSPQKARAKEKEQGFLFGTSSQLALEEDVSYVRDLQMAIQESETVEGKQSSPKRTGVSVGQTGRKLFWSGSRDFEGHVIAANGHKRKGVVVVQRHAIGEEASKALAEPATEPVSLKLPVVPSGPKKQGCLGHRAELPGELEASQVVDLCGTSPISAPEEEESMIQEPELPVDAVEVALASDVVAPVPTAPAVDDSWMLLKSDDTSDDRMEAMPSTRPSLPDNRPARPPASRSYRAATSPVRSLGPRTVLSDLDRNITILAQTSPAKQPRSFASRASPSKSNERPAKTITSTSASAISPKRRRRPPKSASSPKQDLPAFSAPQPPPRSSDFVAIDDISDSESEDLPLREVVAAKAAPLSSKQGGQPPKGLQETSPSKSSFVDLEDISDSDAGKQTPSPRRRKVGGVSAGVRTLELSPPAVAAEDGGLPPIVEGKAAIKPMDPCWFAISQTLFPQISAVVRSTSPVGDGGELSWWEKILMFDPIVIEDLTAWLVTRGVFLKVKRKVAKIKKAGTRKKKGDVEEEMVQVEEFKVLKEELKGWMVQKWCEENSICCLWRDGLRGGVRVRY